jgi:hypothetical protein
LVDAAEPRGLLFLDACCAINLLATGAAEEILRSLPFDVCVTPRVLEEEVLYVGGELDDELAEAGGEEDQGASGPDPAEQARRAVGLLPLVELGALEVAGALSDEELETFISLALEVDDGEAETATAAIHRGGAVATDDRKAIRVLRARAADVTIHLTSSLVRAWVDARAVPDERVRLVLLAIQRHASFVPPRDDPNRDWWVKIVGGSGGSGSDDSDAL